MSVEEDPREQLRVGVFKDVKEGQADRFEASIVRDLLRALPIPFVVRKAVEERTDRPPMEVLDEEIDQSGMDSLPWYIRPRRVAEFNVLDLVRKPARCPVLLAYSDVCDSSDGREPILVFKVASWTKLVLAPYGSIPLPASHPLWFIPEFRELPASLVLTWKDWLGHGRERYSASG